LNILTALLDFIQGLDESIVTWIASLRAPLPDTLFKIITHLGDYGCIWILAVAAMFILKRTRKDAADTAVGMIITIIISNLILKPIFSRMRPYEVISGLTALIKQPSDASFPSGHAAFAFAAAYGIWKSTAKKFGVPALILAVLISLSRIWVGVHFPSDVICGAAIGLICAYAARRRMEKLRRLKKEAEEKEKGEL